jgi:hypothetical protein
MLAAGTRGADVHAPAFTQRRCPSFLGRLRPDAVCTVDDNPVAAPDVGAGGTTHAIRNGFAASRAARSSNTGTFEATLRQRLAPGHFSCYALSRVSRMVTVKRSAGCTLTESKIVSPDESS